MPDLSAGSQIITDYNPLPTFLDGVPTIRALTSLNLSDNKLGQLVPPDGWRARDGDGQAPWIHTDGREVRHGMPEGSKPEGVIAISNAIPTMGAMKKLTISGDKPYSKPVTIETTMTKADFSQKKLGPSGAIMLAAFLPKCQ